jgi:hypothetical protein
MFLSNGGYMTSASVTIAVIFAAGETSKAGFYKNSRRAAQDRFIKYDYSGKAQSKISGKY